MMFKNLNIDLVNQIPMKNVKLYITLHQESQA